MMKVELSFSLFPLLRGSCNMGGERCAKFMVEGVGVSMHASTRSPVSKIFYNKLDP